MKKFFLLIGLPAGLTVALFFLTGFYVVRPIGVIGEGATYWYVRVNTGLPFVSSSEGMLEEKGADVNILSRAITTGVTLNKVADRKIVKFPYSGFLYWLSGGKG
jgi:hypothetical protein